MTPAGRVSVVIPAYNEEHRIGSTLIALAAQRDALELREVLVVDDGSADGTGRIVSEFAALAGGDGFIRLVPHERNRGKATALRTGAAAAAGSVIAFFDADLSVRPSYLRDALRLIDGGADVVSGTRSPRDGERAGLRTGDPFARRIGSRVYSWMQRTIVGLPYLDTQCPFKVLTTAAARSVLPECRIEKWAYDIEVLLVALQQGLRVAELAVEYEHVEGSTIPMNMDYFLDAPGGLLTIRRLHGRYRSDAARPS
jgi:dolichyl-phosphate beta-glucosyltransferase